MKKRILVVDDEAPVRQMLRALLTDKGGFDVVEADTGTEMFRKLNEAAFNLVLLDVMLPDANGLDLLPLIRSTHPHLPVVILSSLGFEDDFVTEATRSGANGFLKKSVTADELLKAVDHVLASP
jgi:DNA-binding NarL/FixJ family response regulator